MSNVFQRLVIYDNRHRQLFLPCARERMRNVNAQKRPRLVAAFPEAKPAVFVLHSLETSDVARHRCLELRRRRYSLGVECVENIPQRGYRKNARGELFGTLVRIILKIKKRVGKLL